VASAQTKRKPAGQPRARPAQSARQDPVQQLLVERREWMANIHDQYQTNQRKNKKQ